VYRAQSSLIVIKVGEGEAPKGRVNPSSPHGVSAYVRRSHCCIPESDLASMLTWMIFLLICLSGAILCVRSCATTTAVTLAPCPDATVCSL
jgi:hypothetical protein